MNQFNLTARRHRLPETLEAPTPTSAPAVPTLADASRAELLNEALFEPGVASTEIDDDRLRAEVRWRRAAILREPGYTALAKLVAAISEEESFDSLTQGDISPAQLIEKSDAYILGLAAKKRSRIPNLENHELRIARIEATIFADRQLDPDLQS